MEQPVEQSAPPAQWTAKPSPSAIPSTPESAGLAFNEGSAENLTVPKQQGSSSNGAFTVSDLQALYQSKSSEIKEGAWAADFAHAMAAVDQTDVLAEEAPFTSVKRQVCLTQLSNILHLTLCKLHCLLSQVCFLRTKCLKAIANTTFGQRQHEEDVAVTQAFLVEADSGASIGKVPAFQG